MPVAPDSVAQPKPSRAIAAPAAVVFVVALAIRLIYAAQVSHCPLFQVPTQDAGAYYALARRFAAGQWLYPIGEPYWQPPFYSMLLAVWMHVAGTAVSTIKNAQFVLGSLNCALILILGSRVLGRRTGLIAGLAAAAYGPMIYFDGELLTPTLQIFLNICAILILLSAVEQRSMWPFAAAGAILGLSIVLRPDVALFAVCAVGWAILCTRKQFSAGRVMSAALLMAVCAVIPIVPFAVRNRVAGHDSVLISANGGINFYIGNNPNYDRLMAIRPGPDWDALQALPTKALGRPETSGRPTEFERPTEFGRDLQSRPMKASQQSAWFYRQSLDYVRTRPLSYAALIVKKCAIYLTGIETKRNHDIYFYRRCSPLYSALLFKTGYLAFPFGILLPLAVMGIFAPCPSAGKQKRLLLLYVAAQFAVTVAFFVCARYRITAVPVLLIFAACGAGYLWDVCRRRTRAAALPLVLALAAAALSNANLYRIDRRQDLLDADTHFYIADILRRTHHSEAALAEYEKSISLNPDYEVSRFDYAKLLLADGRIPEAERELRECLKMDPASPPANAAMGELLAQRGDLPGAVRHLIRASRSDGGFAEKLIPIAEQAYAAKDYAIAEAALRAVVRAMPDSAEARRSLGVVLMNEGRLPEAINELENACRLDPGSDAAKYALELARKRAAAARKETR
jgi:tetratricopeptide (TPR) repeat protein